MYINGPVNAFHLTGNIDGISKSLTIFGDYHPTHSQCSDVDAIDISRYIRKVIKHATKPFDVFFEYPISHMMQLYDKRDKILATKPMYNMHIVQYNDVFTSEHVRKQNTDNNTYKALPAKSNDRVRLHYSDIRDRLSFYYFYDNFAAITKYTDTKTLNLLIDFADYLNSLLKLLKPSHDYTINMDQSYNKTMAHVIDKLLNRYHHTGIFDILHIYVKRVIDIIEKVIALTNKIIKIIRAINQSPTDIYTNVKTHDNIDEDLVTAGQMPQIDDMIDYIRDTIVTLRDMNLQIGTLLTDIYFVQRFLDKDYICDGIIYTGYAHMLHIIFVLVKYFDFTITNASYSKYDIDTTNNNIKQLTKLSYRELNDILMPDTIRQCVNIENFPRYY